MNWLSSRSHLLVGSRVDSVKVKVLDAKNNGGFTIYRWLTVIDTLACSEAKSLAADELGDFQF